MADSSPKSIGRYRILRSLGAGGMGAVYLASDPALDRQIAVKLIRAGADHESDELRQRFSREARSVGRLHHPNIITIFDVGEHAGQPFIAMEYLDGETLKASIARASELSLRRKLTFIDQLFAGLNHAHRAGVIHRDVKPANLMVNRDDVLKILDFGLARGFGGDMTQSGTMLGTVPYMSPEQLRGKPVDLRTDIYSAGVVFYELLSGRPAFPSTIDAGALHFILEEGPAPLAAACPGLDPAIVELVRRCMERSPSDRYQHFGAARRDLASALRRVPEDDESDAPDPTLTLVIEPLASPKTPGPGTREELARLRQERIRDFMNDARTALERDDFSAALSACQQALVIDPDNQDAHALDELIQATAGARQLLAQAHSHLNRGAVTAASRIVDQLVSLRPDMPEVVEIREAVASARQRVEEAARRTALVAGELATCRAHLQAGDLDSATAALKEVLALDPANADAAELKTEVRARLEAQRRAQLQAQEEREAEEERRLAARRAEEWHEVERQAEERQHAEREVEERQHAEREVEERRHAERHAEERRHAEREVEERRHAERHAEERRHAEREVDDQRDAARMDDERPRAADAMARAAERQVAELRPIVREPPTGSTVDGYLSPEGHLVATPASPAPRKPARDVEDVFRRDDRAASASRPVDVDLESTLFQQPAQASARSHRLPIIAVIGGLVVLGLGWFLIARESPAPAPPAATSPAIVRLNITPWATVESVTRKSDGKSIDVGTPSTPCVLTLEPGEYHIRARNPHLPKAVLDFDVSLVSGEQDVRRALPGVNLEEELRKTLSRGKT